jgi:hypothetical protein
MRKVFLAFTAATGLLLALGASAEAAGRTPGAAITSPPGWQNNTTGQTHGGWTNSTPPGWQNNTMGQTKGWLGTARLVAPVNDASAPFC